MRRNCRAALPRLRHPTSCISSPTGRRLRASSVASWTQRTRVRYFIGLIPYRRAKTLPN